MGALTLRDFVRLLFMLAVSIAGSAFAAAFAGGKPLSFAEILILSCMWTTIMAVRETRA